MQAAGRVIRTEHDRGAILLIDSRYRESAYRALLPPHWSHMRRVESAEALSRSLATFWENTR
jgi:Rad3-related DNA helicase